MFLVSSLTHSLTHSLMFSECPSYCHCTQLYLLETLPIYLHELCMDWRWLMVWGVKQWKPLINTCIVLRWYFQYKFFYRMKKNIYQTGIGISLEIHSINTNIKWNRVHFTSLSWLIMSAVGADYNLTSCHQLSCQSSRLHGVSQSWRQKGVRCPLIPRILATPACLKP